MGMTGDQYGEQLDALLPQGLAWPREQDARIRLLTRALAEEFSRVDARGDDLVREANPATTSELLPDWEAAAGLPDDCVSSGQTLQERRAALISKLTEVGGASIPYFIQLAASLGYTITIDEFEPFRAGFSRAGDPLAGENWQYAWRINAPGTTITDFRASLSAAGEPLRKWGNELLECVFSRLKPAHTVLLFGYVD
ncbi:YmfQ family protein [Bradyrhizobium sp.]|uniref:YmfQ family protein n=1 Tax=Bradyrhizobium sp. TaxID=376 RepID=UPI0039E5CD7D